ncbi:MAG: hypothetical protein V4749_10045, partial [Pseudomonadota bacterium]
PLKNLWESGLPAMQATRCASSIAVMPSLASQAPTQSQFAARQRDGVDGYRWQARLRSNIKQPIVLAVKKPFSLGQLWRQGENFSDGPLKNLWESGLPAMQATRCTSSIAVMPSLASQAPTQSQFAARQRDGVDGYRWQARLRSNIKQPIVLAVKKPFSLGQLWRQGENFSDGPLKNLWESGLPAMPAMPATRCICLSAGWQEMRDGRQAKKTPRTQSGRHLHGIALIF